MSCLVCEAKRWNVTILAKWAAFYIFLRILQDDQCLLGASCTSPALPDTHKHTHTRPRPISLSLTQTWTNSDTHALASSLSLSLSLSHTHSPVMRARAVKKKNSEPANLWSAFSPFSVKCAPVLVLSFFPSLRPNLDIHQVAKTSLLGRFFLLL